jgi:hypothetical protein
LALAIPVGQKELSFLIPFPSLVFACNLPSYCFRRKVGVPARLATNALVRQYTTAINANVWLFHFNLIHFTCESLCPPTIDGPLFPSIVYGENYLRKSLRIFYDEKIAGYENSH